MGDSIYVSVPHCDTAHPFDSSAHSLPCTTRKRTISTTVPGASRSTMLPSGTLRTLRLTVVTTVPLQTAPGVTEGRISGVRVLVGVKVWVEVLVGVPVAVELATGVFEGTFV